MKYHSEYKKYRIMSGVADKKKFYFAYPTYLAHGVLIISSSTLVEIKNKISLIPTA